MLWAEKVAREYINYYIYADERIQSIIILWKIHTLRSGELVVQCVTFVFQNEDE